MIKDPPTQKIWLFQQLTNTQENRFIAACEVKSFSEGEIIMEEGELGRSLYIIQQGGVNVYQPLTLKIKNQKLEETENSISKLKAEDEINFFGEIALISPGPRSATVKAISDCQLYEITSDAFQKICEQDPDLGYKIIRTLNVRLVNIVRKNNKNIQKLTTALSFSLKSC